MTEEKQVALDQVSLKEPQGTDGRFERDVVVIFDPGAALERRNVLGGTTPSRSTWITPKRY